MTDPVRAARRRVAKYVKLAKRIGYLFFLASVVLVVVGLAGDFTGGIATAAVTCLIVGSVLLAPAVILGYAVNAAEREDRARGL